MSAPIYLDNNASTALDARVLEEMLPALRHTGNPSSDHYAGWWARRASDRAREQIANLLHASPQEVVFTSGATEANNLALKGLAAGAPSHRRRIVSCRTEHPAVLQTLKALQRNGFDVVLVDVDEFGLPDTSRIRDAVDDSTLLLTVMAVNNETGVACCGGVHDGSATGELVLTLTGLTTTAVRAELNNPHDYTTRKG